MWEIVSRKVLTFSEGSMVQICWPHPLFQKSAKCLELEVLSLQPNVPDYTRINCLVNSAENNTWGIRTYTSALVTLLLNFDW